MSPNVRYWGTPHTAGSSRAPRREGAIVGQAGVRGDGPPQDVPPRDGADDPVDGGENKDVRGPISFPYDEKGWGQRRISGDSMTILNG